jgi:hypothetical protein
MKPYPLPAQKDYPLWHHRHDNKFIDDCLFFIPYDLKPEVSDKYERIYQSKIAGFRGAANKYLHTEAMRHKQDKEKSKSVNVKSYLQKPEKRP